MQIIPPTTSSPSSLGDALMAQLGHSTRGTESFADALLAQDEAQQQVDSGTERSVSTAQASAQQPSAPLQEAPCSVKTKTDSGTYTLNEVCFTKTELVELRQELITAGAPPETLEKFDKLVNQPDGATLAQVMASLQPGNKPPQFSDDEKNALKSLLQKIDATGALEDRFMGFLDSGNAQGAWKLLSQTMTAMDPGTRMNFDRSEIAVLGKALGLSEQGQSSLLKGLGSMQSMEVNPGGFLKLMGAAQSDLTDKAHKQQLLNKALDATLNPVVKKARKRMDAEQEASALQNRKAQQSKVMIQKTVTSAASNTVENTATGAEQKARMDDQADAAKGPNLFNKDVLAQANAESVKSSPGEGLSAADQLRAQLKGQTDTTHKPDKGEAKGLHEPAQEAIPQDAKLDRQHGAGQKNSDPQFQQSGERDPSTGGRGTGWEGLLGKVEVRSGNTANSTANNALAGLAGISNQSGLQTPGTNASTAAGGNTNIARHVASQVEQAMLGALRDGSKKLELQLTPGDLGTMTLTLTARNGEVSAIIRSERPETAELMTRQLDVLRTNLEQQGIKIDKLEVQTQSGQQNNDSWQGMNQHNAQQEEHARREQLDRIRNLGKLRNSSTNDPAPILEQGMQLVARTAQSAAQSLHIVA